MNFARIKTRANDAKIQRTIENNGEQRLNEQNSASELTYRFSLLLFAYLFLICESRPLARLCINSNEIRIFLSTYQCNNNIL